MSHDGMSFSSLAGPHTGALADKPEAPAGTLPAGFVRDPRFSEPVSLEYLEAERREEQDRRTREALAQRNKRLAREAEEAAAQEALRAAREEEVLSGNLAARVAALEGQVAALLATRRPTRIGRRTEGGVEPPRAA